MTIIMQEEKDISTYPVEVSHGDCKIVIGGNAPVVIQSMTNTDTEDVDSTVAQIIKLVESGSELVRLAVNTGRAAHSVLKIRNKLDAQKIYVPLIGDFHYNGHQLLSLNSDCAKVLSKYRVNPGNVGSDIHFSKIVEIACKYNKPIRIGVNWGSIDRKPLFNIKHKSNENINNTVHDIMIQSALNSANIAESIGLKSNKIILSCKTSSIRDLIDIYCVLSTKCRYSLHLGLTEAGLGSKGIVATSAALAILLNKGIGDTIRVSLTPEYGGDRAKEVVIAQEILQTMGLRYFVPLVTSCPGCGRTDSNVFQQLAGKIQSFLYDKMPIWKCKYPGVEKMKIAVMGCVVNGPGESRYADIGISLPGRGEFNKAIVFVDGEKINFESKDIVNDFQQILIGYVDKKYKLL